VANLERLRGRLPLIVFILLAIVVLMLIGFACACLTDDPMQAVERALSFAPALPDAVGVWATLLAMLTTSLLIVRTSAAVGRASPALLQRFRF
jgi:hypothetical protein